MTNPLFDHPTRNPPNKAPSHHWRVGESGQSRQQITNKHRPAEFATRFRQQKNAKTLTSKAIWCSTYDCTAVNEEGIHIRRLIRLKSMKNIASW